jgi:hypothetical protein
MILLNGMDMMEDGWLSAVEIADYLIIKRGTVYKWIGTKNIPYNWFTGLCSQGG